MFEEKGHSFFAKNEGNKIAIVTIRDYFVVRIDKKSELLFIFYTEPFPPVKQNLYDDNNTSACKFGVIFLH